MCPLRVWRRYRRPRGIPATGGEAPPVRIGGRRGAIWPALGPSIAKGVGRRRIVAERGTTGEAFHDREDPRSADDLQDECPDDAEEDSGGGDGIEGHFGECDVGGPASEGTEGRMLDRGRQGERVGRLDGQGDSTNKEEKRERHR